MYGHKVKIKSMVGEVNEMKDMNKFIETHIFNKINITFT